MSLRLARYVGSHTEPATPVQLGTKADIEADEQLASSIQHLLSSAFGQDLPPECVAQLRAKVTPPSPKPPDAPHAAYEDVQAFTQQIKVVDQAWSVKKTAIESKIEKATRQIAELNVTLKALHQTMQEESELYQAEVQQLKEASAKALQSADVAAMAKESVLQQVASTTLPCPQIVTPQHLVEESTFQQTVKESQLSTPQAERIATMMVDLSNRAVQKHHEDMHKLFMTLQVQITQLQHAGTAPSTSADASMEDMDMSTGNKRKDPDPSTGSKSAEDRA